MFSRNVLRCCSATAAPGVANHTPRPKKNPIFAKIANVYMTKIPSGIREFVIMGPLCLGACLIVYNMESLVPESMKQHMSGATPTQDIMSYTLEPVYDADTGRLKAYRKVLTSTTATPSNSG